MLTYWFGFEMPLLKLATATAGLRRRLLTCLELIRLIEDPDVLLRTFLEDLRLLPDFERETARAFLFEVERRLAFRKLLWLPMKELSSP